MKKEILEKMYAGSTDVNLSEQKVELALIDDVKKITNELNNTFKNASDIENKLDAILKELYPNLNKADAIVNQISTLQKNALEIQKKFVAALKELGLEPSASKENFALFDILDSIETRRERITDILSNFN